MKATFPYLGLLLVIMRSNDYIYTLIIVARGSTVEENFPTIHILYLSKRIVYVGTATLMSKIKKKPKSKKIVKN